MLHLVGCLYYLYQWCAVKQISDNEICFLIKHIKSVLWRVAKRLSYIEDARCLKVYIYGVSLIISEFVCLYSNNIFITLLAKIWHPILSRATVIQVISWQWIWVWCFLPPFQSVYRQPSVPFLHHGRSPKDRVVKKISFAGRISPIGIYYANIFVHEDV